MSSLLDLINKRKAAVSRIKTIKPNPNRNRYRILPSWRGPDQQFWMDFGQHFIKDAAGQVQAVYICTDKTFSTPCPVCAAVAHGISVSTDDLTTKRLTDAKSTARVLLNVLALDSPTPTVPQILEVAPTVFNGNKGVGGILSLFTDWPNLLDLASGAEVIIEKQGAGKETRYGVSAIPAKTPVDPSVLAQLHNLDEFVKQESEQGRNRALTSVSAISGLLPPPSATGAAPMTPSPGLFTPVAGAAPMTPAAAAAAFSADDLSVLEEEQGDALDSLTPATSAPLAQQPATPVAAAAPAVPQTPEDAELESLLSDLG